MEAHDDMEDRIDAGKWAQGSVAINVGRSTEANRDSAVGHESPLDTVGCWAIELTLGLLCLLHHVPRS